MYTRKIYQETTKMKPFISLICYKRFHDTFKEFFNEEYFVLKNRFINHYHFDLKPTIIDYEYNNDFYYIDQETESYYLVNDHLHNNYHNTFKVIKNKNHRLFIHHFVNALNFYHSLLNLDLNTDIIKIQYNYSKNIINKCVEEPNSIFTLTINSNNIEHIIFHETLHLLLYSNDVYELPKYFEEGFIEFICNPIENLTLNDNISIKFIDNYDFHNYTLARRAIFYYLDQKDKINEILELERQVNTISLFIQNSNNSFAESFASIMNTTTLNNKKIMLEQLKKELTS